MHVSRADTTETRLKVGHLTSDSYLSTYLPMMPRQPSVKQLHYPYLISDCTAAIPVGSLLYLYLGVVGLGIFVFLSSSSFQFK